MTGLLDKIKGNTQIEDHRREPSPDEVQKLREKYEQAKQDHVFSFWDDLSSYEKAEFYDQLSSTDPHRINEITHSALLTSQEDKSEVKLEPLPEHTTASTIDASSEAKEKWYTHGLELVAAGEVGVILMAGGQGTRLGSTAPKGCFDIDLPSQKSLFQLQAERIRRLQMLAESKSGKKDIIIPWYIMTSGPTRAPTETYFKEHNWFGLSEHNVIIFEQGVLPCVSNDGKILLETKSRLAVAPDGNGGIYQALLTSNARTDMRKRGLKHIHAYCVDNCLVKVADPSFVGFAASKSADIATKVVRKRSASEPVGLILLKSGKAGVVEYSEIDKATAEARDPKQPDVLKYRAANIVNHYYSFAFLETIEEWVHKLPHHVAKKKIPCINTEDGNSVKPDKPNGIKLEQFVFDVFPMLDLDKFACLEVIREDEFSPLKNAAGTGEDDPKTSKGDILRRGKRWIEKVGGTVVSENSTDGDVGVDISPLISYAGEGLEFLRDQTIKAPAVIEHESAQK